MGTENKHILQRLVDPIVSAFDGRSDWEPTIDPSHYSNADTPIRVEPSPHNPDPAAKMRKTAETTRAEFRMDRKSKI